MLNFMSKALSQTVKRVLITGANGFIGKNLVVRLRELPYLSLLTFLRNDDLGLLNKLVGKADAVIHLAGENRPKDENLFNQVNKGLTKSLCDAIYHEKTINDRHVPLVFASSIQAEFDNSYGRSKLAAEEIIQALANITGNSCNVFRLPGVFGKWCKPNYNSVVATFCHNIACDFPVQINNAETNLRLVYIDDVVNALLNSLDEPALGFIQTVVNPEYLITLGDLAAQIRAFGDCRSTLMIERTGSGLIRALYATYLSYLPKDQFSYKIPQYVDPRGVFVEMLKTQDSGQISYFTCYPGVIRGEHYHHTKNEKFLVIKGKALFRFRHLLTDELLELHTSGYKPQVVVTIPGWAHDITNIGNDEMVVMLWANEIYDRANPDTIKSKVLK